MDAGPSLLRLLFPVLWASSLLPVFGAAVGPEVRGFHTLLGLISPPAPQNPQTKQRCEELGCAAAGCGEDCRQITLPSKRTFGQVRVLASCNGPN